MPVQLAHFQVAFFQVVFLQVSFQVVSFQVLFLGLSYIWYCLRHAVGSICLWLADGLVFAGEGASYGSVDIGPITPEPSGRRLFGGGRMFYLFCVGCFEVDVRELRGFFCGNFGCALVRGIAKHRIIP